MSYVFYIDIALGYHLSGADTTISYIVYVDIYSKADFLKIYTHNFNTNLFLPNYVLVRFFSSIATSIV